MNGIHSNSTEILDQSQTGTYKWSINRDYNFSPTGDIFGYSTVNVPKTETKEEYLLLIGGCYSLIEMKTNPNAYSKKVHKYNGSWSFFGNLRKTRAFHSSLFLDGRILIIGGGVNWDNRWQKTEIWDTKNSEVSFPIGFD